MVQKALIPRHNNEKSVEKGSGVDENTFSEISDIYVSTGKTESINISVGKYPKNLL